MIKILLGVQSIITLGIIGHRISFIQEQNNKVSKIGNLSFWVNSRVYNIVENVHQVWLLSVIDSIIHDKKN